MKKILISMVAIGALSLAVTFGVKAYSQTGSILLAANNVEALTQDEGDTCPYGCYDNGDGCYCYGWYDDYRWPWE